MRKYVCLALLIFSGTLAFSQDVIINGGNKNWPLNWDDFKGQPDKASAYDANTYWTISYNIKGISFKGDTAKISGFSIILSLQEKLSWSKPEKQTDILLKHEQGHFDLGLICQREIMQQLNSTIFFKEDFKDKIPAIFSSILKKYQAMEFKYDEETNHSKNQSAQESWNNFFLNELK